MSRDLIERLRVAGDTGTGMRSNGCVFGICHEAADRIAALEAAVYEHKTAADAFEACWKDAKAALEAEASEGERRGLERGARVADQHYRYRQKSWKKSRVEIEGSRSLEAQDIAAAIRALIPAPAREGELEAAAKAIFEQKGLHLSTGKPWESAITADRYYCLQYAEAVLVAIGRRSSPPQDREEQ